MAVLDNILAYSDYIFICNWNFTCGGIWEIMIIKAKTISGLDHADLDLVSQSNLKSLNCKISMDDPDLGHWDYRYDPNGNLIFQSGGGGNLVTGDGYYREYDNFGKLIRVRNGSTVTSPLLEEYTYNHDGQRMKIKRNDSANTIVYTPFKELMRVVNSTGSYDFTYVYDGNTLVARINPDGSKYFIRGIQV